MTLPIAIYEWQAWDGYMLPALLPEAVRIPADPLHSVEGILAYCPADTLAFAFHLNCTRTENFPRCRRDLIDVLNARGVPALNAFVTDIGKRRLQETCRFLGLSSVSTILAEGSPEDFVIVKTDLNYAGFGEKKLSSAQLATIRSCLPPSSFASIDDYRVLPRREVPAEWWYDQNLVIELFVENRKHRKFRTYFAGCNHFVSVWTDENVIKKYRSARTREELLTTEQALARAECPGLPSSFQIGTVRLLRHLRMDFGALDFVEDDAGECYAIDVNSTSYGNAVHKDAAQHLRSGLLGKISSLRERPSPPLYMGGLQSITTYVDELLSREKEVRRQSSVNAEQASGNSNNVRTSLITGPQPGLGPIRAAGQYRNPGDLCVITSLFNIRGCQEKLRNFAFTSALLRLSGIPLIVVECVSDDDPWDLSPSSDVLQLRASAALWQKERLVNCALSRVPPGCTKIAWIDADILFQNAAWAVRASELLSDYSVVQLGDRLIRLPRGRHSYAGDGNVWESFGAVYLRHPNALLLGDFGLHGHTGFGWAARRNVLESVGLYDACIAGGGDHVMAHAFCGDWESACLTRMLGADSAWHRHAVAWARRVYPLVRARLGVVEGAVLHLWHGELASRGHVHRYEAVRNAQFDPDLDIEIDQGGCWRWRSVKPPLHAAMADYLANRSTEVKVANAAAVRVGSVTTTASCQRAPTNEFTCDFTTRNIESWRQVLSKFAGSPNIRGLEIGCYEGRSGLWFLENVLQHESSRLICVDPSPRPALIKNLHEFRHKVRLIQSASAAALRDPSLQIRSIHFMYVDGDHSAPCVLEDAILAFPLLVSGGIMIFDDYLHESSFPDQPQTMPKLAVDSFVSVYRDRLKIVHKGYQLIVERL
jgi:predicted O-methyltransferase YrrM